MTESLSAKEKEVAAQPAPAGPEVVHRAAGRFSPDNPWAFQARCGPAWFEGGYAEPMRVTVTPQEVTCPACRMSRAGRGLRRAIEWAFVLGLEVVDRLGNASLRIRRRPRNSPNGRDD